MNNPTQTIEKPSTQKEIATFLSITTPTLIKLRNEGKIPYFRIGGKIMYQPSRVLEALIVTSDNVSKEGLNPKREKEELCLG